MAQWSIRQVWLCLIGSSCITFTLSVTGYLIWSKGQQRKLSDPAYQITSIVQTGPEKEALKTTYLAELLSLSTDRALSLYALDCKVAKEKLLSSPLISSACVKRIPPSTLYIDYEVRKPIAKLADYENIGIDTAGYIFPIHPFFSPKELPEIYLGLPPFGAPEDPWGRRGAAWLTPIQNRYFTLALEILKSLEGSAWREGIRLKKIDTSNAFALSLGQREVVLFTEEEIRWQRGGKEASSIFPKILRLAPKDYAQQIHHFFVLRKSMNEDYKKQLAKAPQPGRFQPRIIDLRIPQLAFIENHL
jgi:hypothetical protein